MTRPPKFRTYERVSSFQTGSLFCKSNILCDLDLCASKITSLFYKIVIRPDKHYLPSHKYNCYVSGQRDKMRVLISSSA